jgi:hypothetical protein
MLNFWGKQRGLDRPSLSGLNKDTVCTGMGSRTMPGPRLGRRFSPAGLGIVPSAKKFQTTAADHATLCTPEITYERFWLLMILSIMYNSKGRDLCAHVELGQKEHTHLNFIQHFYFRPSWVGSRARGAAGTGHDLMAVTRAGEGAAGQSYRPPSHLGPRSGCTGSARSGSLRFPNVQSTGRAFCCQTPVSSERPSESL